MLLKNKIVKTFIKLALSGLAVFLVFRKIDAQELWQIVKSADWFCLLLAVAFFVLSKIATSLRLNIYFRNIGLYISEKENLFLYMKGMYYNLFLPGGIGGDGYKVYLLNKRYKVSVKKLLQSVLLDRLGGLVSIVFLLLLFFLFIDVEEEILQGFAWDYVSVALAILVFPAFYLIYLLFFKSFLDSFIGSNLYSLAGQLLQIVSAYFILIAIGVDVNILEYQFVFLLSSIAAVLPLTIGGVGVRELVFIFSHEFIGIDKNTAVAFSLIFFLISALVSFTGFFVKVANKLDRPEKA
ncbi:lysylphosphatidylglycerol synthase transmembrane domain-containing protein [Fontibacter flavus]|uniref:Lysylphosphatidylglycerol synthase transmembrane domain-containing protein n=1 Tax=Fontibacter flavus TaxID=654838 RepID=A0ABV6FXL6_9BACT